MSDCKRLFSIRVPVFNEEQNIQPLYNALLAVMEQLSTTFELVFTDNHSTDRLFELLEHLACWDKSIRVVRFSRNFGLQRSILTGYAHARGDEGVHIDCDLQDPPALINQFVSKWEQG